MNTTADVLIVGAGPTGLMLANQLARRGVRPLIIDRHSGPAQQTRAIGVQARTLEIYSKLSVIDQALERGMRTGAATMWAGGKRRARVPIGDIGADLSPFPFLLMLGQDDNEDILGAKLRDWGVEVQWNTELVDFEQHDEHVAVKIRQPNGEALATSVRWIAGCDGSRSFVREHSRIDFPGAPYEHVFFVADTIGTGDMSPGELNVFLWKQGFHLFFPMRGDDRWRVIGILPPELRARDDLTFEDVIPDLRKAAGASLSFSSCHWFSTYRIHHRAASRFRDRRCFLLGDAAHIHSPMGAQGMNTGLQDAYNLAWKLALVVKGEADASLLDSYEAERKPVARRLLDTTDRAFMLVVSDTPLAGVFRTRIMWRLLSFAMRRERIRRLFFRAISQIGIEYGESSLSRTLPGAPSQAPQAGVRFPWMRVRLREDGPLEDLFEHLDDKRFNLIVVGQAAPELSGRSELMRTHSIPADFNRPALAAAHIPIPSFYLLRPDGHIGLAGAQLDREAIAQYFDENLAARISPASLRTQQPSGAARATAGH
jgi:2-polyprenyl-6-methoxyphenol hydroxylase-like FAD-dependent oxidoreductase